MADATLLAEIKADASNFNSVLKGVVGQLGGLGSLIGGLSFAGIFTGALKEAAEAEENLAQLDMTLQRLGKSTDITREQITDFASNMARTTRYTDDTVVGVERLFLRVKGLGKNVLPMATQAALDMATATGGDATSAANLLTKALERPANAAGMLARQGIILDKTQQNLIHRFMATGQAAKAQQVILDAVMGTYGGAAEAAGNTFAGKLDILQHQFQDILETIGNAFLPILSDVVSGFSDFIDMLGPSAPVIVGVVAALAGLPVVFGAIGAVIGVITGPIGLLVGAFLAVKAAWDNDLGGIRTSVMNFVNTIKPELDKIGAGIKEFFDIMSGAKGPMASPKGHVGVSERMKGEVGGDKADMDFGQRLKMAIDLAWPQIQQALAGIGAKLTPVINQVFSDALSGLRTLVADKINDALINVVQFLHVPEIVGALTSFFGPGGPIDTALQGIVTTINVIKGQITAAWNEIFGPGGTVDTIIKQFRQGWDAFWANPIGNLVGVVSGIIGDLVKWLETDGMTMLTGVWTHITNAISGILAAIGPAIVGAVVSGLLGIIKIFKDSGVINLIPGLAPAVNALEAAVKGAKAGGGPIGPGSWLVGETGPEVVNVGRSGYVTPNNRLSGGGINVTLNANGVNDPVRLVNMVDMELQRRNRPAIGRR